MSPCRLVALDPTSSSLRRPRPFALVASLPSTPSTPSSLRRPRRPRPYALVASSPSSPSSPSTVRPRRPRPYALLASSPPRLVAFDVLTALYPYRRPSFFSLSFRLRWRRHLSRPFRRHFPRFAYGRFAPSLRSRPCRRCFARFTSLLSSFRPSSLTLAPPLVPFLLDSLLCPSPPFALYLVARRVEFGVLAPTPPN